MRRIGKCAGSPRTRLPNKIRASNAIAYSGSSIKPDHHSMASINLVFMTTTTTRVGNLESVLLHYVLYRKKMTGEGTPFANI